LKGGPKGPRRQAVPVPQPVHDQPGEEIADDDTAAGLRRRRPRLGCLEFRLNRTDAPTQYPPRRGEWKVTNEPAQGGRNRVTHTGMAPPPSHDYTGRARLSPLVASAHQSRHAVDVCLSECQASLAPERLPLTSDREERNKVLGMPRGVDPYARQGEEPQRVLGVPDDWYGPVDPDLLRFLRHPIKACKHWTLRRHLGIYAPEERDPEQ
jgi:hypothetical protein